MGIPRPSETILVARVRAFVSRRRDPPAPSHARAGTTPSSALGGLARMYDPPRAVFDFSGLSGLGRAGKLLQNYLEFAERADRLVSGWTKPFEGVFERLRRATEFYPCDPDRQPIPPWNVRLYRLARAAYRTDDYEAQARFLDEIGADGSVDNVLFVRELLAPTFDPVRPDRHVDWWLMEPNEAKAWLCKPLKDRDFESQQDDAGAVGGRSPTPNRRPRRTQRHLEGAPAGARRARSPPRGSSSRTNAPSCSSRNSRRYSPSASYRWWHCCWKSRPTSVKPTKREVASSACRPAR